RSSPDTRLRAPCGRRRGSLRARRTRAQRRRSTLGLRSGRTPSSATHLVNGIPAEDERLFGLILVCHPVPALKPRIVIVRVVIVCARELREDQVLLHALDGNR